MSDDVLAAVLLALAGARSGDRVAAVGAGQLVERCLLAASGGERLVSVEPGAAGAAAGTADVVVAGAAFEVPSALQLLRPGGRLVAVAADAGAAERVSSAAGLVLRHTVVVGTRLAWAAQSAALPADTEHEVADTGPRPAPDPGADADRLTGTGPKPNLRRYPDPRPDPGRPADPPTDDDPPTDALPAPRRPPVPAATRPSSRPAEAAART